MRKALVPGGYIVMAGILDRHERLVISAYETQGMALVRRYRLDEWTTLVLRGQKNPGTANRPGFSEISTTLTKRGHTCSAS